MKTISKETRLAIQKEYNALPNFHKDTMTNLAAKYNLTLKQLLNLIDL